MTPNGTQSTFASLSAGEQMAFLTARTFCHLWPTRITRASLNIIRVERKSTFVPGLGEADWSGLSTRAGTAGLGIVGDGRASLAALSAFKVAEIKNYNMKAITTNVRRAGYWLTGAALMAATGARAQNLFVSNMSGGAIDKIAPSGVQNRVCDGIESAHGIGL